MIGIMLTVRLLRLQSFQKTVLVLRLWDAIIESTVWRFRPIMLMAAAAILAMVPLSRSVFWSPMATAIMSGLSAAMVLTCLFLPAFYAAWFRVKPLPAGSRSLVVPTGRSCARRIL